jgi:4-amino-4-deoxy-L-arabinose transferase-like glycosyltransferase
MNKQTRNRNHQAFQTIFPKRTLPPLQLLILSILFSIFRIPFLGHILSLDEAWILSALKSIAGGQTLFTDQFYRHPPLYLLLGLNLSPLKAAFEYRLELLTMLITLVTLIVLVKFSARYFGHHIALYTGIVFSLAPGPVFFDTWIKRDCLVTLLGLLAIWAVLKKREIWAGILLGLAFLSKETAIFFGLALFFLILLHGRQSNIGKKLLRLYGFCIITAGGWYLFVSKHYVNHWNFFTGKDLNASVFIEEWWFYFFKLRHDLGAAGLLFFIIGLFFLFLRLREFCTSSRGFLPKKTSLIPLSILLPAYLILSLSSGKPPWLTISLYPYLSLVSGVGIVVVIKTITRLLVKRPKSSKVVSMVSPIIVVLMFSAPHFTSNYAKRLNIMCPGTLKPIQNSYIMAEALNKLATDGETALFLPDLYRGNPKNLDPILFWLLKKKINLIRSAPPPNLHLFKEIISRHQISWVIIYPANDSIQEKLLKEIQKEFNPDNYWTGGGLILKMTEIWNNSHQGSEEKTMPTL